MIGVTKKLGNLEKRKESNMNFKIEKDSKNKYNIIDENGAVVTGHFRSWKEAKSVAEGWTPKEASLTASPKQVTTARKDQIRHAGAKK